jgi:hypothetical protein
MTDRQFFWGLSNGLIVLAIAGTFWLGIGFGPYLGTVGWVTAGLFTVVLYGTCAAIVWFAIRLRRRSGFKRSELKLGDERQRAETRKIMVGFRRIGIAQTILIALVAFLCVRFAREELLWPSIGFIVSLHFIPLGRIFHLRADSFIGIVGGAISFAALLGIFGPQTMMFLGGSMGLLMWLSAVYIVWRLDRIGAKALREPWAS